MDSNKNGIGDGVYTATLTPLKSDLTVDHQKLAAHCRQLLEQGSHGIALLGTTGEANSFSVAERHDILEALITNGIDPSVLMVGTGCCSLPDTLALTQHASRLGVGGVLVLPPFYYKQVTDNGLVDYFSRLIDGVGETGLRIYLYHFPKMSGVPFTHELIGRLIDRFPDNIAGMKDSSGDLDNMCSIQKQFAHLRVFAGTETHLLAMLLAGGAGCISATANVSVPLARQVYNAWKEGADTDELDGHLCQVRKAFDGLPFTGALKRFLSETTGDSSWQWVRPPNEPLDDQRCTHLIQQLKSIWPAYFDNLR